MLKYKIFGLIGVILDVCFTMIGTNRYGIEWEANPVVKYILRNEFYLHFVSYIIMYYAFIYLFVDIFSKIKIEVDKKTGLKYKILSYFMEWVILMVCMMGYTGAFSWILLFFNFK